jgi:succinyl-CoA synthetase beta subunit
MARLYEHQGKKLLEDMGFPVPGGHVCTSAKQAREAAEKLNCPVVVKAQAWTTKRKDMGGIAFADTPETAEAEAKRILGLKVGNFTVEEVLVERRLDIEREFYAGVIVDDSARRPLVIFSSKGGTGIEEIAREHPESVARVHADVVVGLREYEARDLVRRTGISGKLLLKLGSAISKLVATARRWDARSAEINPLVLTTDGDVTAADCRISVDDYAVFRHRELGIDIARELDRPATPLDRIAYDVEAGDYRGTFYFIQMEQDFASGEGYVGFHGAGGGGSMMSMDAVQRRGYKIANFCDTSGNPPASKVYRAAKIILAQGPIDGYFASGSGVASQEQFHSARGIAKAFLEEWPHVPAVIRLGGNQEEKAIEILHTYLKDTPCAIEGYGRDDSADFCAERLDTLIKAGEVTDTPKPERTTVPEKTKYEFATRTGSITIDHARCEGCADKPCIAECIPEILKDDGKGHAVLAITEEEAKKGGCVECLACEFACRFHGEDALRIELPIPGLDEYRAARRDG